MFLLSSLSCSSEASRKTLLFHLGNRKRFPIKCSGANKYYWKALELVVSVATAVEGTAKKNCLIFLRHLYFTLRNIVYRINLSVCLVFVPNKWNVRKILRYKEQIYWKTIGVTLVCEIKVIELKLKCKECLINYL